MLFLTVVCLLVSCPLLACRPTASVSGSLSAGAHGLSENPPLSSTTSCKDRRPCSHRTRPNRQEWQEHWHRMPDRASDGPCGSIPRPTVLNNLKWDYTTDPPGYYDAVHASPTIHHTNQTTIIKSRIAKSLTPRPYNIIHNERGLSLCLMF